MASTTAQKLKIKEGDVLLTLHAPDNFKKQLGPLPPGVKIVTASTSCQQLHWFVTNRAGMEKELKKVISMVKDDTICWIYYPKGTSGVQTDLTRDKGWDKLLAYGDALTWISLISFDDTWSAFGCRRKTAADKAKKATPAERPILQYIDAATKTIRLPEDLDAALKKNKPASEFFNSLSFTNRKEYVEWIVTAKQEATRSSRLEGTIDRLEKKWKNPRNM